MTHKETLASWIILMQILATVGVAGIASDTNEPAVKIILVELTIGRILHVNTNYNYVILQCGSLPSPEEEATVCRGGAVVARLKFSGANRFSRFPFVAADVMEGHPQKGDIVKQTMKRRERTPSDGRKE